ncbi:MAG: methyltransferase, TIGR04325 family [Verrucomicrobiota bacterium]
MWHKRLKAVLKELLPPIVQKTIGEFIWVRWHGDFPNWKTASDQCSGYHSPLIFTKVRAALLKVKNGRAASERDSMVFETIQHSYPLLAVLNYVARRSDNQLHVLDFGGSMGTSYFQNRAMLGGLKAFHWCIVDQKHFVKEGQLTFSNDNLHFYDTVNEAFAAHPINFVLLSGVLQFLEKPWDFLEEILARRPEYLMIDRTTLLKSGQDRITIQTVPKSLYDATYPCWLLNRQALWDRICQDYELLLSDDVPEWMNIKEAGHVLGFFKLKSST